MVAPSTDALQTKQPLAKRLILSADEQERYWAEARDRALSDEVTMLNAARRQGTSETGHRMLSRLTYRRFGEAAAEQSKPLLEHINDAERFEELADELLLCTDADAWLTALRTAANQ